MKKKLLIFIPLCIVLIVGVALGAIKFSYDKELSELKNKDFNLPEGFTYTAHTGCVGTKENSLEAIEAGVLYGAQIVEFDLNFTKNGEAVLAHDEPEGGEITLREAFCKVSEYPYLRVNVDAKSCENLKTVVETAEKYNIKDRIFFTGIELSDVEKVKNACPGIEYYLNCDVKKEKEQTEEYLEELVKTVRDCGAVGINFNKKNATKKLVEKFRENGLSVSIWTVNDEKEMYEILLMSPDNITTRNPDKMQEILSKN